MCAIRVQAMLDIAYFLEAVARLVAIRDDEARRGAPDMMRAGRMRLAVLMNVPAHDESRHAAQRFEQGATRPRVDETAGDFALLGALIEKRLVQQEGGVEAA